MGRNSICTIIYNRTCQPWIKLWARCMGMWAVQYTADYNENWKHYLTFIWYIKMVRLFASEVRKLSTILIFLLAFYFNWIKLCFCIPCCYVCSGYLSIFTLISPFCILQWDGIIICFPIYFIFEVRYFTRFSPFLLPFVILLFFSYY